MALTNKQVLLSRLKKTYCRIQPSSVHGVGVFAIRDISYGINPFEGELDQTWFKFRLKDLESELNSEIIRMIDDFLVIEKDHTVWIPKCGINGLGLSFYMNNSDNPNMKSAKDKNDVIIFTAARQIKKGEELTIAYCEFDHRYK